MGIRAKGLFLECEGGGSQGDEAPYIVDFDEVLGSGWNVKSKEQSCTLTKLTDKGVLDRVAMACERKCTNRTEAGDMPSAEKDKLDEDSRPFTGKHKKGPRVQKRAIGVCEQCHLSPVRGPMHTSREAGY